MSKITYRDLPVDKIKDRCLLDNAVWQVLVYSQDEEIIAYITQLLNRYTILGREISLSNHQGLDHAYVHSDQPAVVFLDVKNFKGDLALFFSLFSNKSTRVIVIDNGLALDSILRYDITEVISKSELLTMDLRFKMTFILKSYIKTRDFELAKVELKKISDSYKLKVKAINESHTGIAISDARGNINWINTSFKDITRLDEKDVIGLMWERILVKHKVSKAYGKNDYHFKNTNGPDKTVEVIYKDVLDTAGNIINSVIVLHDITERVLKRKELYRDIEMARKIQFSVLPKDINVKNVDIMGIHKPVDKLGGDMYYFEELSEDKYGLVLLDVMGHGIATSLITMYIRSLLSDIFKTHETPSEIAKTLQDVQNNFNATFDHDVNYYFTSIIIIVDFKTNTLKYVNAGHPSGIVTYHDGSSKTLNSNLIPIGLWENKQIDDVVISTENIANILLYTDGFSEAKAFDFDRVYQATLEDLNVVEDKFKHWFKIIEQVEFHDDVSMVWMKISRDNEG